MKILSADQIREADRITIKQQNISEKDLIERAGKACFDWIYDNAPKLFSREKEESAWVFHIICGPGNNGGDGLVIGKHLLKNGYSVRLYVLNAKKRSKGFAAAESGLGKYQKEIFTIASEKDIPDFADDELLIDCLFGTGLSRPIEGLAAKVVNQINQSGSRVLSIDIPSGLFADGAPLPKSTTAIHADYILSFQVPKLAFVLPENEPYIGEVVLLDIQMDQNFLKSHEASNYYIDECLAADLLKSRSKFGHKGTFGTALVIAGSRGSMGAAIMAVRAVSRSGAGMVVACVPECGLLAMQISNPEAKVLTATEENFIGTFPTELSQFSSIGVGPGMGTDPKTVNSLKLLLQNCQVPLVLDADAINILAENTELLSFLPTDTILTPHPGEFRRLVGEWSSDEEKLMLQRKFCKKYNCIIILKGRYSSVCFADGRMFFNSSGNDGMATAGAGDVLTGILTGLLASGYSAADGAIFGTYLHGAAGDIAAGDLSREAMVATDIIDKLASAFKQIANIKYAH